MSKQIHTYGFTTTEHYLKRAEERNTPDNLEELLLFAFLNKSFQKKKRKRTEVFFPKDTLKYLRSSYENDLVIVLEKKRIVTIYWVLNREKYFFQGRKKLKNEIFVVQH